MVSTVTDSKVKRRPSRQIHSTHTKSLFQTTLRLCGCNPLSIRCFCHRAGEGRNPLQDGPYPRIFGKSRFVKFCTDRERMRLRPARMRCAGRLRCKAVCVASAQCNPSKHLLPTGLGKTHRCPGPQACNPKLSTPELAP